VATFLPLRQTFGRALGGALRVSFDWGDGSADEDGPNDSQPSSSKSLH
jgi:hypothetical protein